MENKDLIGKKFKEIKEDNFGGIQIEFLDGTVIHFGISTYPDGTVSDIYRDKVLDKG